MSGRGSGRHQIDAGRLPATAKRLTAKARRFARSGNWAAAAKCYRRVLSEDPLLVPAWVQYAHALKEQGDLGAALAAYNRAVALEPRDADIYVHLGHVQKNLGRREDAVASLRRALSLRPSRLDVWRDLCDLDQDVDDLVAMVLQADSSAAPAGRDYGLRFALRRRRARAAASRQDWRAAIGHCRALVSIAPSHAESWTLLGDALREEGDVVAAVAAYLQAAVLDPLDEAPHRHLREVLRPAAGDRAREEAPATATGSDDERTLIEASGLFDREWYLTAYHDVATSGSDPLQHYLLHGIAEGRNPNPLFDTRWYLAAYPDVRAGNISPLAHYIATGATLGCDPHPFFSTTAYLAEHPEARETGTNPLSHFLHRVFPAGDGLFPSFTPYDVFRATEKIWQRRERPDLLRHIETMTVRPDFLVFIDGGDAGLAALTRDSVTSQLYQHCRIISSVAEVTKTAEESERGSAYFLWLRAGDQLDPEALYRCAAALNADPTLELIYFDEDVAGVEGSPDPFHRPDWSPDYLESFNYIGSAACFELHRSRDVLAEAAGLYDFTLRFTERSMTVAHLDQVLLHRAAEANEQRSDDDEAADIGAILARLARTGRAGTVTPNIPGSGSYDVYISLNDAPLVSVILPTAGRIIDFDGRSIDLITECLEAFLARSSYKKVEFIIVDNGDFDRGRLRHLRAGDIKFATWSEPEVNIAKKINLGASLASGDVLLILNDDVQPLTVDWIERMLGHLEKPHVGVVGAKLLYPNGTIQHAGIVSCDGEPEHVRRGEPRDDVGYRFSTCGVRNYLAVTGAVSMTTASKFWRVGGYSEDFPTNYNDVDFCYKIVEQGLSVVYEPKAELLHYESASIVTGWRAQDAELFARKWARLANDPFYNQHCLSVHPATFCPAYRDRKY